MEMYEDSFVAEIPELKYGKYLFEIFGRCGICSSGMAGAIPLTWGDVNDWCIGNGLDLYPTERQIIIRMSEMYVSQLHKSDDPLTVAPAAENEDGSIDYSYTGQMALVARSKREKAST